MKCDMGARRSDSVCAGGAPYRVTGLRPILLLGRRPNHRSVGELKSVCSALGGGSVGLGMQWLNDFPFADNRVLQIGLLAVCGIAALIVLAIVYRLTFAHRLRVPGGRTRQPRLGLVDAFSLDGQRQLVLIRRDNIEHLVMIGGPNDVLVESQINRAVVPARESNLASPLLVPSAPVRRTEAAALPASPAVPEPPPKVAAKVPASPLAPPPAAPAPAAPVPKAPAPAQPTASVSDQAAVPTQPTASVSDQAAVPAQAVVPA